MPNSRMIYKAGKLSFLLVCLFLCTACRQEKTEFVAGEKAVLHTEKTEELSETPEETSVKMEENLLPKLVNINTADEKELMSLPGIGQVRAAAIIEYRQREGNFEKIEDIMNVKGIKTGIFSKINNLICVK